MAGEPVPLDPLDSLQTLSARAPFRVIHTPSISEVDRFPLKIRLGLRLIAIDKSPFHENWVRVRLRMLILCGHKSLSSHADPVCT
jgi:hypothetical protein